MLSAEEPSYEQIYLEAVDRAIQQENAPEGETQLLERKNPLTEPDDLEKMLLEDLEGATIAPHIARSVAQEVAQEHAGPKYSVEEFIELHKTSKQLHDHSKHNRDMVNYSLIPRQHFPSITATLASILVATGAYMSMQPNTDEIQNFGLGLLGAGILAGLTGARQGYKSVQEKIRLRRQKQELLSFADQSDEELEQIRSRLAAYQSIPIKPGDTICYRPTRNRTITGHPFVIIDQVEEKTENAYITRLRGAINRNTPRAVLKPGKTLSLEDIQLAKLPLEARVTSEDQTTVGFITRKSAEGFRIVDTVYRPQIKQAVNIELGNESPEYRIEKLEVIQPGER